MGIMTDDLKPVRCGCGGEAHHDSASCWNPEEEEWMPNFWHRVICKNCGTQTKAFYTEAEAIQTWNRAMSGATDTNVGDKERTAKVRDKKDESMIDEWHHGRCMNCGKQVRRRDNYCSRCESRLEWK